MTKTQLLPEEFVKLLARPEGPTTDFKRDAYDLTTDGGRGSFIKDVLSMANTPRSEPAYIVLGVAEADGKKELVGLAKSVDDAVYQDTLKSKVHPCPNILYIPILHEGRTYGVIVIQPDQKGPCQATTDVGKVRRYVIYWRRGTQNDEARADEQEAIRKWCTGYVAPVINIPKAPRTPWEEFLRATYDFEGGRLYVLVTGPSGATNTRLTGLATAPWDFVLDFEVKANDPGSVAQIVQPELRTKRAVHEVMLGDNPTIHVDQSCYWYYARGAITKAETTVPDTWSAWKRKYGHDVSRQLQALAANRNSRPATFIALWDSEDHIDTVFSAALDAFGEAVSFVVAHPSARNLQRLSQRYEATLLEITLEHVADGLHTLHNERAVQRADVVQLPTKSGTRVTLEAEVVRYLEEELEILGMTSGTIADEARETCSAFLRGKQITWFELGLNCDVERDKTERVLKAVLYDLGGGDDGRSKGTTRINIYHAPGAGGSTIGRCIAWRVHLTFPTVVLKKSMRAETASRLETIYRLTALPILLLLEGADVQESQTEELYSTLRARQVSVVFLQVLRRFSPIKEGDRSFYLATPLSQTEANRFAHKLSLARPERRKRLLSLASNGTPEERSAFYFALETFEKDFEGLPHYVRARLSQATPQQTTVLVFLALAHHYGHRGVPASAFAALLGLPRTQKVKFDQVFPQHLMDLLRVDSKDIWRTAHDLIALELLRQALAPGMDNRHWRQNLSTWAVRFVNFCRSDDPVASADMVEVASRCFVFRDDSDRLGTDASEDGVSRNFSHLIQDIPSQDGRLIVLQELTKRFPDEAHFWGHLGRFYSLELHDSDNALRALNKAIELSPGDGVLYHMKGMALRSQLYKSLQPGEPTTVAAAVELAEKAAEQFALARDKDPFDEHGYVSHIQMLLRLVEFAKRSMAAESAQKLLTNPLTNPTVRESVDVAEDLLEQAGKLRQGERPSAHVEQCRVQLDALYGRFNEVLQGWDNLLSRTDVYRPPIRRQLVQTYVVRRNRHWERLEMKEIKRIVELLEQNLLEEPHERRNLRLWLQAVRRMRPPLNLENAIEKVTYWKTNTTDIDPVYYLYILHALRALDGYELALGPYKENLEECRRRSRMRPNRTGSFEWLGRGDALARLVHYSELGGWSTEGDFWRDSGRLSRVRGTIGMISGPQSGHVDLSSGVRAFFVPGRSDHAKGRDENRTVDFYLGFSYDGPRAWEVQNVS